MEASVGMSIIRNCLIANIQVELYDSTVLSIQKQILDKIQTSEIKKGVIDLSTVSVMDSYAFQMIADTVRMASYQGATIILAGLQPGVVSAIVDLDFDVTDIQTVRTIEDAMEQLAVFATDDREESDELEEEEEEEETEEVSDEDSIAEQEIPDDDA